MKLPAAIRQWLWRLALPEPDPDALAREIAAGAPDRSRYNEIDRYRDYRRLFLEDARGLRVLNDIIDACGIYRPTYMRGDSHETARREGKREIGLMVLHRMNYEPANRPTEATSEAKED